MYGSDNVYYWRVKPEAVRAAYLCHVYGGSVMVSHVEAKMHIIVHSLISADAVMPSERGEYSSERGEYSSITTDSYQDKGSLQHKVESSLLYNIIPRMNMIKSGKKKFLVIYDN